MDKNTEVSNLSLTSKKNLIQRLKASKLSEEIIYAIRQSLDYEIIFETATTGIREFLNAERVGIYYFIPGSNFTEGEFVAEDVISDFSSALAVKVRDRCFGEECAVAYRQGKVLAIADIYAEDLSNCHVKILERFQIRANLIIPLLQGEKLWGLLCIHQCSEPRQWQDEEIKIAQKIANQLSIALYQAQLLAREKEQRLLLEQEIEIRQETQLTLANQLKISQLVEQITQAIRQSLDPQKIFVTATREIRQLLKADRVGIFKFAPASDYHQGEFVAEDVISDFPSALAAKVRDRCFGEECAVDYRQGKVLAIADIYAEDLSDCHVKILERFQIRANLVIPLLQNEQLWGLLCIHQCSEPRHWQDEEIDLVQKIATQLGVALNHAELLEQMREAKENADAANQAKSTFLANMSHELRTPLNAILGFSQLLHRDDSFSPQQKEILGIINHSGKHLLELINDVLEMSKIEAGKTTFHSYDFDLHGLLDSLRQMFSLKAESKDLQLIVNRSANVLKYIRTDEHKLRQVLINLLNNGIKFTQTGKIILSVSVKSEYHAKSSEPKQQEISFTIQDTGVGIAKDRLKYLFKPFSQTQSGYQSGEGTGLGLCLSRNLVQLMGGRIDLQSQLGKGTTVRFTIPITEAREINLVEPDSRQVIGLAPNQSEYRILVVEDKWESRKLLVQLLESVGFLVQQAQNGKEAVEKWQEWQPHLILMDMQMPVMNGYESTKNIRLIEQNLIDSDSEKTSKSSVIIAFTASAFKEERNKILAAGCDDFMSKPLQELVLFEKIKHHLAVEFIYQEEESKELVEQSKVNKLNKLNKNEVRQMLSSFPKNWVKQLHAAALTLDEEEVLTLLDELKDDIEKQNLAYTLTNWLDNCQLDLILSCTQEII